MFTEANSSFHSEKGWLFHDFVAKFLDYRVCQNFLGHALDLLFSRIAGHAVQIEDEKLALANIANLAKSQRRKGMLYGLTLRIKDRALGHDPHVCFHGRHYTKPSAATPE
jgi:hypothetical protein